MPSIKLRLRRFSRGLSRRARVFRMIVKGLVSTDHPINVHLIPMRRCNLSCSYCNEYDNFSSPVPLEVIKRRIDRLAELGTTIITISGGEPLLHPQLEDIIRYIRSKGIICGLITNGYLLTPKRIQQLNEAGLDYLQISIDNVMPDEVSKKSLKVLDKKLQWLSEYAEFPVNINTVVGSGVKNPWDALTIAKRAVELGFSSSVGVIHDHRGQLKPLGPEDRKVWEAVQKLGKFSYARMNYFQRNIVEGKPNNWRCRAGARYLYVCEDGLVHYCSQQRGYPGKPLEEYTVEDIRREFITYKPCSPTCTISCVHQTSYMDFWRAPQTLLPEAASTSTSREEQEEVPVKVQGD